MIQGRIPTHTEIFLPIIHDLFRYLLAMLYTECSLVFSYLNVFFIQTVFGRLLTSGGEIIGILLYKVPRHACVLPKNLS